ncbi:hypothetical protein [Luteimonas salinilitoris]
MRTRSNIADSDGRMTGPAQRAGRSERTRGSAAQAPFPYPLEYQLYYTV